MRIPESGPLHLITTIVYRGFYLELNHIFFIKSYASYRLKSQLGEGSPFENINNFYL